jgi:hypothetical protein
MRKNGPAGQQAPCQVTPHGDSHRGSKLVRTLFLVSLLPEDARFEELVQDCYLAYRGAGLMLSALDAELLSDWAGTGVPYEVIARGIRRAAERALWDTRPGEPALHTLRSCSREVSAEIRKYQDRSAGRSEPSAGEGPPVETIETTRHKRLRTAVKKMAKAHPAFEAVAGRLLAGPFAQAPENLSTAARREELVVAALTRTLPSQERLALAREVRQRMAHSPALTPRAKRMSRRFHREALLRMKLELPPFW